MRTLRESPVISTMRLLTIQFFAMVGKDPIFLAGYHLRTLLMLESVYTFIPPFSIFKADVMHYGSYFAFHFNTSI